MRLRIADREMTYEDIGSGTPLVLLHAFPFDRRMWWATAAALSGRLRVITPDLRGFGESPASEAYSIADLADDVAALLDGLGISRATIGGLSWGGYIALAFAARHGARLEGLILADTKAGPDSAEARRGRDEAISLVQAEGVEPYLERQLPRLLSRHASDSLRAEVQALGRQSPDAVLKALPALRDRPDRWSELPLISCPTVVIVGQEDALTPASEARAMAGAIPDAQLVELPGAGHLSNLEAPDAFAAALTSPPLQI
jgi:pimeloyl-ACP methyl ester carboxylesterase